MPDLVHSSRPRPDLVQTDPVTYLVHSSRSSIRTNGRVETEDAQRTPTSSSSQSLAAEFVALTSLVVVVTR